MKAILCKQYGTAEQLVVAEVNNPAIKDHEVLINVRACGINFPDVLMIAGQYQVRPPMPFTPGAEVSGTVSKIGKKVRTLKIGQRVLALCGHGGLAEQAAIDANYVVPIPDSLDFATAAGFMLTYGTAYYALQQRGALQPGDTLLVLGAAGGVGLAAVELGTQMGAKVIAAASTAEKLRLAEQYGAAQSINYSDCRLIEAVREATSGRGADLIFDPVGGPFFEDCLRSVAWNGRILVIGFASGEIPSLPANLVLLKGSSVVGVFWGSFARHEPELQRRNTHELLKLIGDGRLHPHISDEFDLEHAADAILTLARRRAMGKVIVNVSL